jgi:hypothetical protein
MFCVGVRAEIVYRVVQVERSVFWEIVIARMNTCLILSGHRGGVVLIS